MQHIVMELTSSKKRLGIQETLSHQKIRIARKKCLSICILKSGLSMVTTVRNENLTT